MRERDDERRSGGTQKISSKISLTSEKDIFNTPILIGYRTQNWTTVEFQSTLL